MGTMLVACGEQVGKWVRFGGVLAGLLLILAVVATDGPTAFAQSDLEAAPAPQLAEENSVPVDLSSGGPRRATTWLEWMVRASGIFGFSIMLLAFIMLALVLMLLLQLRRMNYLPADFIDQFEQKLNARDYAGAYEIARNDDSLIARVLAGGMQRLPRGEAAVQAGMQDVGDDEALAMEQKVGYLGLIASIAPMLGLAGTVLGMLGTFQAIAQSTLPPQPFRLADGIATALFTTLEGLVVAIPAMVAYAIFRNRLERFLFEAGVVADGLMDRIVVAPPASVPANVAGSPRPTQPPPIPVHPTV